MNGTRPTGASDRELELKYAVTDAAALRAFLSRDELAGFTLGPWRTVAMVDRYVDTPARSLEAAGLGARLRQSGGETLVTVKRDAMRVAGEREALHDRLELEAPANRRLDPARWPQSPARTAIEQHADGERLRTLFLIDQKREERDLVGESGEVVATLSLDAAVVRRFGRRLGSFSTLEVESVPGAVQGRAALEAIARELEASALVQPEARSKERIGLEMIAARTAHRAEKPPKQPGVRADDSLATAGRKVLRMQLLRMLEAEPGVRAGDAAEPVHKMRVATRRMRAAWRVFEGATRQKAQKRYVGELRTVAAALGAVRDLDVQLERLAAYEEQLPAEKRPALEPLVAEWQRRRGVARMTLLDLLDSRDYDDFVDDYHSFVEDHAAGIAPSDAGRVVDTAAGRIWRAYEHVRAHDQALPWADVPALHALRIDGKRLRYTLEFFREVLPPTTDGLIADVTAMQDHLGLLNDAQVAADLTRLWLMTSAGNVDADARQAAGAYLRASERDVARQRRSFRPVWRRVSSTSYRRRLALTISAI